MAKTNIYIYLIWFSASKKCYVGQTNNLDGRMKDHLKSGSLVCKALWKYDDWQISILHTCKSRDEANRIEIEEIRNFNSVAPNGYNLTRGGEAGSPCEETRKKMSDSLKGNQHLVGHHHSEATRRKLSVAGKGRKHSEETKKKISKSYKSHKHSEETRRKLSEVMNRTDVKYKRLRTRIQRLERELAEND